MEGAKGERSHLNQEKLLLTHIASASLDVPPRSRSALEETRQVTPAEIAKRKLV